VLADTQHGNRIEHTILPFRDFFGALFFFGFGLTIDPLSLGGAFWPALGAVAVTLAGNVAAGILAGRAAGHGSRASLNIGMTIVSRGEFSIIMAGLARTGGLSEFLQPFAALYVLTLAVLGPLLTRESERIYDLSTRLLRRFRKERAAETDSVEA
jgi:CPA2 family monovalent cation:H+ antiporter-2